MKSMRILAVAVVLVALAGAGVSGPGAVAQAGDTYVPSMTFDVASIREAKIDLEQPHMVGGAFSPQNGSSLRLENVPARWLLEIGYGVRDAQISGAPDWVFNNLQPIYDVEAKSDVATDARLATLTKEQVDLEHQHMIQALLAERFNLKAYWETREGPVLDLVAVKGSKLHAAMGEPPTAADLKFWGGKPVPTIYQRGDGRLGYEFLGHSCPVEDLARMLAVMTHETVVDKTGLTGKYDFDLKYSQRPQQERTEATEWPLLKDAVEDQLGLKFEDAKGPTRLLVIDHIDRPSAN